MSTPTFEPTVFVDLTREQIVAILNGGSPPAGAHPLSAAEMNRIGQALAVLSTNLNSLQGSAQTSAQVQTAIQAAVATLIGGAPEALNTFVELANALGNDPNKITALSTAIAAKYSKPTNGIPAADLASDVALDGTYAQLGSVLRTVAGETPAACATRLQAALDAAVTFGYTVTLAEGDFTPSEPLRLNTGQRLTLWNARVIRQDNGATSGSFNTQILVNKNINATGNSDIRVQGIGRAALLVAPGLLTTAKRNPDTSGGRTPLWSNVGVAFVNCTKVRVSGVQIGPTNAFAGNTQLCSDVIWSDIELVQDASVANQDGIDVGPGSSNIHIRRITGQTGDDFCSIYAQRTSGSIEQSYVKGYLDGGAARANISGVYVKQVTITCGLTSGNVFRVQAGDGATFRGLYVDSLEVLGDSALTVVQLGNTSYITTIGGPADLSVIELRNISGSYPRLLALDAPWSSITVENAVHSGQTLVEAVGYRNTTDVTGNGLVLDGFRDLVAGAGGVLVHLRPNVATADVTVRNVSAAYATAVLVDEFGNTGLHLHDVKIKTLAGVPFQVKAATAGSLSGISWDTATAAVTASFSGASCGLRMAGGLPTLTSADVLPKPLLGSTIVCDAGQNPTGDAVTGAGMYAGSGAAWARIVSLAGDTQAPTVPGTPTATAGAGQNGLTWTASTDNVAVTGYRIYRSDAPTTVLGISGSTSYTDTAAPVGTAVTYTVAAYDAAGNQSAKTAASNSVTATAPTGAEAQNFADAFTRADQTGGLGAGWTVLGSTTNTGVISNNQASSAYDTAAATRYFAAPTNPTSPNQYAQLTTTVGPSGTVTYPALCVRMAGSTTQITAAYRAYYNPSTGAYELSKTVSGTATVIASLTASAPTLPSTMRLDVDSTHTLKVKVGGTTILTFQDTSSPITAAGVTGMSMRSTSTAQNVQRVDDFSNGTLAGG